MIDSNKIVHQVFDDRLIGLENRITFLETMCERQQLSNFSRDTNIMKKLLAVVELLLIPEYDLSRTSKVQEARAELQKILKKMIRKRR